MEFSVIFEAQMTDPSRAREREVLRESVEQAVFAEEMGFDRIWAVEHHSLRWYAHMSAPEIFLTWVAARTSRIRIGHGVVCLPFGFNHPVRAGERLAMLDNLSGGRLDVGAGRGATRQEMSLFGVEVDDTYPQLEEALRMIGHMWLADEFSWDGLLTIAPHPILPRPVQEPHPPLFMACTKPDTVELAADLGVGALVMGFAGPGEIARLRGLYDAAWARRTGERSVSGSLNRHFTALCPTIVLDDARAAVQIGARGQRFFAESIAHWYGGGPEPSEAVMTDDVERDMRRAADDYVARLHEANIPVGPHSRSTFKVDQAYGTADDAVAYVEQLRDAGADEIMCLIQMGPVPHDVAMATIRAWGEKVIPHFRAAAD